MALGVIGPTAALVTSATAQGSSWGEAFAGRGLPLPPATPTCAVCFYEKPHFQGSEVCVGPRDAACSAVLPISAPSTIGSVRFRSSASCNLVVNVRVLDPPYGEHIESHTADVADTGYHATVEELYVERAGRACFLAAVDVNDYGQCYSSDVPVVERRYRDAFVEVLLFQSPTVIVYEHEHFNAETKGLSKRLTESTRDLDVHTPTEDPTQAPPTLQYRIRSIQFVANQTAALAEDFD